MTTRPYELLARFAPDGSVAGVSVRTITTVNGRDFESDPSPLSGASDPVFVGFANQFSAAIVAQRDQLLTEKQALTQDLAAVNQELSAAQSQLAAVSSELDTTREELSTANAELSLATSTIQTLNSDLAAAQQLVADRDQRIIELEGQLEALINPPVNPRHLAPYTFLSLLKPEEIIALQTSADPTVIVGRAKLQTIITYIDLDHQETIGLVRYMESIGLLEPGRADQILKG